MNWDVVGAEARSGHKQSWRIAESLSALHGMYGVLTAESFRLVPVIQGSRSKANSVVRELEDSLSTFYT
jgi:hypothetical protein